MTLTLAWFAILLSVCAVRALELIRAVELWTAGKSCQSRLPMLVEQRQRLKG